ncbi:MAG: GntR family transcriptional regulator [Deltaproteobacteria bacterium]|nr:GntR family transcriptional regulator [Deltaproteobacteria bacterium]
MKRHDGGIPFYIQVAETLRRRMATRDYPEGSLLPSTEELEREFGVSEITIRKALALLTKEGMLQRRRGLGTIVAKGPRELVTMELSGQFDRLVRLVESLPTDLQVLEVGIVPCPHHVADSLRLEPGSPVWRMKKLRRHDGSPLCHYLHYSRPELCQGITRDAAEKKNFVDVFREATGLNLVTLEQRLEASSADTELSSLLRVRFGAPLLFLENLFIAAGEEHVLLTQIHYRADRCTVKARTPL